MKHLCLPVTMLCAALFTGCGPKEVAESEGESSGEEVSLYEKGRGVRLPDDMKQRLKVETVEVAEKSVTPRLEVTVQVFRAVEGTTPAAGLVWLSADQTNGLRLGQPVRTANGLESIGTLARLAGSRDDAASPIEAIIEFTPGASNLTVGGSVPVTLMISAPHPVMAVPDSAVTRGVGGAFVYAANGAHYTRTPVKTGVTADGWVEIKDGLYAGDQVVAKASESLWLIELCALKGGSPCCPVERKQKGK